MIAYAFNNRGSTRVTYRETFAGHAANEYVARRCTIQSHVTNNDILLGRKRRVIAWIYSQLRTRQSFTYIIVCFAFQLERNSLGGKSPKALSGRTLKFKIDGIIRQSGRTILFGYLI